MNYTVNTNEDSHRGSVLGLIGRTYTVCSIESKNEYTGLW